MPDLYRQIRLAVFAVLAYATSVVDVALILGPTTPPPLAVRILLWLNDPDLPTRFAAAAGALLQVGVTGLALLAWLSAERAAGAVARMLARTGRRGAADGWLRRTGAALVGASALVVLIGIGLLALWSVAASWRFPDILPSALSLGTWMRLAPTLFGPFGSTIALAAVSGVVALALALGALEFEARSGRAAAGRALQALYVPLLVPQVAFLFGLQILLAYAGVDGTFAAVALVHLVFVFPYALLSLSDPWRSWDPRYGQMARSLGRGPDAVFWRVRLPMLARPALTALAVGFAISVGLYLPTLLIGAGRWPTVTTETVALASGGDRRLIGATALVQALLPFLGFAVAAIVPAVLFRHRRRMRAGR
jgi:putative thiamine transport system permease protein